ncbi:hypothetical protein DEH18_32040 [Streptomyces sp. NHF165]|nr:hypothetical protein DEH18_32040 [Streptomyces sp. NHF165]
MWGRRSASCRAARPAAPRQRRRAEPRGASRTPAPARRGRCAAPVDFAPVSTDHRAPRGTA